MPAAAERSARLTLRALRARSAAAPARPVCPAGGAPPAPPRPSRLPGGDTSGLLGPGRWVKGIVTLRGAASASGCFSQIEGVRREYLTFQRRFAGILLVSSFFFSLFFSLLVPARTRLAFRFRLRVSKAPGGAGPAFGPSRRHGDAVPAALRRPRVPQHQAEAAGMGAHALGHDGLRAGGGVVLPHHRRYRRAAPGEAAAMEVAWLNVLRRPAGHRMRCLPASCRLGSPPSLETPN